MTKTHKLTFEAQAGLWPNAAASAVNHLQIGARVVSELLEHFSNKNGGEVTFWCAPTFLVVRSKSEDVLEKSECAAASGRHTIGADVPPADHHIRRSIQTNVKVDLDAFEIFKVTREACVTFPLKEFKVRGPFVCPLDLPLTRLSLCRQRSPPVSTSVCLSSSSSRRARIRCTSTACATTYRRSG